MASLVTPPSVERLSGGLNFPNDVPDFDSTPTNNSIYLWAGSLLLVVMLFFVTFRIYYKLRVCKELTPDDYTCVVATVLIIALHGVICYDLIDGKTGRHLKDIPINQLLSNKFLVPAYIGEWFSALPSCAVKATFPLLYLQLFWPDKWIRWGSQGGLTVLVLFYAALTTALLVLGTPRKGQSWAEDVLTDRYYSMLKLAVPISGVGLAFDLYFLVLPLWGLLKLEMSGKRKLGLMLVFSTGLGACIASALSVLYRVQMVKHFSDFTWHMVPIWTTTIAELEVGLACSCMPATAGAARHHRPLFKRLSSSIGGFIVRTRSAVTSDDYSQPLSSQDTISSRKDRKSRESKRRSGEPVSSDKVEVVEVNLEKELPPLPV